MKQHNNMLALHSSNEIKEQEAPECWLNSDYPCRVLTGNTGKVITAD